MPQTIRLNRSAQLSIENLEDLADELGDEITLRDLIITLKNGARPGLQEIGAQASSPNHEPTGLASRYRFPPR